MYFNGSENSQMASNFSLIKKRSTDFALNLRKNNLTETFRSNRKSVVDDLSGEIDSVTIRRFVSALTTFYDTVPCLPTPAAPPIEPVVSELRDSTRELSRYDEFVDIIRDANQKEYTNSFFTCLKLSANLSEKSLKELLETLIIISIHDPRTAKSMAKSAHFGVIFDVCESSPPHVAYYVT
jgi:hypothetical protein